MSRVGTQGPLHPHVALITQLTLELKRSESRSTAERRRLSFSTSLSTTTWLSKGVVDSQPSVFLSSLSHAQSVSDTLVGNMPVRDLLKVLLKVSDSILPFLPPSLHFK